MLVNRLALLAGAAATAIVVTGCAPTGDTAIKVGKTTYSNADVDLLTRFECSIAQDPTSGSAPLSRQSARAFMASILVASAIDHQISVNAQVRPTSSDVASTMSQLDPYIDKAVQGKDRDRLRGLIESSVLGQVAVGSIVQQTLGSQLSQMTQEQAQQVVGDGIAKLRENEAAASKIVVDPVFGLSANGLKPGGSDPSLSTAVSSFAKAAAADQPAQAWLDELPANQKCS